MMLKRVIKYPNANALEATWVDENDNVVKCHAYSDAQMSDLRRDLGEDALKYEPMIAEVEANIVPPEPKTPEQTKAEIESAIQAMLDAKAKEMRYDNMMSARSYAGFENPFQAEAQALAVWCAECWTKAGELEALGAPMTAEEVLAEMPVYGA